MRGPEDLPDADSPQSPPASPDTAAHRAADHGTAPQPAPHQKPAKTKGRPAALGAVLRRLRQPIPGAQPRLRFEFPPEHPDNLGTEDAGEPGDTERFGSPGPRISTQHPLYLGFMGTVGVGLALLVYWIGSHTTQLLLWIVAALFIALGLDPVVRWLEGRKIPRPAGILVSVSVLMLAVVGFFATLIPTIVEQVTELVKQAPVWVRDFINSDFFRTVDNQFGVRDRITEELDKFVKNPEAMSGIFGGVVGLRFNGGQRPLRHPDRAGAQPLLPRRPARDEEMGLPAGTAVPARHGSRRCPRRSAAPWATTSSDRLWSPS